MVQKIRKNIFNRKEPVLSVTNSIEKRRMNTVVTMDKYSAGEETFLKIWAIFIDINIKESRKNPITR